MPGSGKEVLVNILMPPHNNVCSENWTMWKCNINCSQWVCLNEIARLFATVGVCIGTFLNLSFHVNSFYHLQFSLETGGAEGASVAAHEVVQNDKACAMDSTKPSCLKSSAFCSPKFIRKQTQCCERKGRGRKAWCPTAQQGICKHSRFHLVGELSSNANKVLFVDFIGALY